jgi:hypothetical protein
VNGKFPFHTLAGNDPSHCKHFPCPAAAASDYGSRKYLSTGFFSFVNQAMNIDRIPDLEFRWIFFHVRLFDELHYLFTHFSTCLAAKRQKALFFKFRINSYNVLI